MAHPKSASGLGVVGVYGVSQNVWGTFLGIPIVRTTVFGVYIGGALNKASYPFRIL